MNTLLQFAILGLGAGGAYAIAAVGLLQVYRGSGVLNLAHGATAYASATLFVYLYSENDWSFVWAGLVSILLAAVLGVCVQLGVMYPLRNAPPLVRMIGTLGVFAVISQGIPLVFGTDISYVVVKSFYPAGRLDFGGSVKAPYDRLIVVALVLVLGVALAWLQRRTRLGLATTSVAENRVVAASLGINPNRVAVWNWALGSALAGLAGVLLVPVIGSVTALPYIFLVVPALAAAMIGRFDSFALTVAGGLAIGIGESLITHYQTTLLSTNLNSGWDSALPFLVIVVVLVLRGSPFPSRGEIAARLPRLGRMTINPIVAAGIAVLCGAAVLFAPDRVAGAVGQSAGLAVICMSLFVLTGLAGQTSLAQMVVAGIGAMVAARLSDGLGLPFLICVILGVVVGTVIGVVFAAPAMRTRGPALAIATIGIGLAIQSVVLNNGWFTKNGVAGTPIESPRIFGLDINGFDHPQRYAAFVLIVLVIVAYTAANFRAGRTGRRLIAMRSSERGASASGISLARTKMTAFTVSAALASLGGILIAFQGTTVTYTTYDLLNSFNLVVAVLIGGVGYVLGPVLGGINAPNGLITSLFSEIPAVQQWLVIASGFVLILTLIANPHGIAAAGDLRRGSSRRKPRRIRTVPAEKAVQPAELSISGLTVMYGSFAAVTDLSVTVRPGEIVGLIGPNGAGKTSALDAITGFTRAAKGEIRLGDRDLSALRAHERAQAGLGRSFQTVETFDDLTVAENLAVASNTVGVKDWLRDVVVARPVELDEELEREAASLGLDLHAMPDELSQGLRRVLGVLRALALRPSVLLLDEPAAGLDRVETEQLAALLRQVARERGIAMLLVEHDMSLVAAVCDRVVALDFGVTIVTAPTEEALADPTLRAAYLGELDVADDGQIADDADDTVTSAASRPSARS